MYDIELGDHVKDRTSGHEGIVTSRTEHLNGCIQFGVRAPLKKDKSMGECYNIDVEVLDVVRKGVARVKSRPGGGPTGRVPASIR